MLLILVDAVRGYGTSAYRQLYSNQTTAEQSDASNSGQGPYYGNIQSLNSDGFTIGGTSVDAINKTNDAYVAWNWKANGAGVTNTAGTITSTVSANTTSGFSVVTFATGANTGSQTIGHGLGVAPSLIISKVTTTTDDWLVYHSSLGTGYSLRLNTTAAALSNSTQFWGSTFNSTVFSGFFGSGNWFLANNTYVAYCFAPVAGYSAFGSYTGNGSTDGPFIYTGFRPAWVMWKNSTSASQWILFDVKRWTYNIMNGYLEPNTSDTENTGSAASGVFDILSNGFKLRVTGTDYNQSGDTYVYAAFAEVPTKFSLAR